MLEERERLMLAVNPEEQACKEDIKQGITEVMATLWRWEAVMLAMHFGLPPYEREHSYEEIGKVINLSGTSVKYHIAKALRTLRQDPRLAQ